MALRPLICSGICNNTLSLHIVGFFIFTDTFLSFTAIMYYFINKYNKCVVSIKYRCIFVSELKTNKYDTNHNYKRELRQRNN